MRPLEADVDVPGAEPSLEAGAKSVLDTLRYRTVAEALRVAERLAQSGQHRAFCERVRQFQSELSPEAAQVLEQIEACGSGRVRSTSKGLYRVERERCKYPVCPTCGVRGRNRELPRVVELFLNGKEAFGDEAVSLMTVNMEPCLPSEVREVVSEARKDLSKLIAKASLNVRIEGEFEFAIWDEARPKGRRKARGWRGKLGEGSMTTPTLQQGQKVKPHLHAIVVHPGISRGRLSRLLGSVFKSSTGDQPVRVERITDRIGAGGRWVNGPNRVVSYFLDKSAAVKGEQRSGDILAQIAAFEAYVRLSGGQRRRPRLRIGKRVVPMRPRSPSATVATGRSGLAANNRSATASEFRTARPLTTREQMRALAARTRQSRTQPVSTSEEALTGGCRPPIASQIRAEPGPDFRSCTEKPLPVLPTVILARS
jgi:hypothetical protein